MFVKHIKQHIFWANLDLLRSRKRQFHQHFHAILSAGLGISFSPPVMSWEHAQGVCPNILIATRKKRSPADQ